MDANNRKTITKWRCPNEGFTTKKCLIYWTKPKKNLQKIINFKIKKRKTCIAGGQFNLGQNWRSLRSTPGTDICTPLGGTPCSQLHYQGIGDWVPLLLASIVESNEGRLLSQDDSHINFICVCMLGVSQLRRLEPRVGMGLKSSVYSTARLKKTLRSVPMKRRHSPRQTTWGTQPT